MSSPLPPEWLPGKPSGHFGYQRVRLDMRESQLAELIELAGRLDVSLSDLVEGLLDNAEWDEVAERIRQRR